MSSSVKPFMQASCTAPENDQQIIQLPDDAGQAFGHKAAGIVFYAVNHEGNTQKSEEEAEAIAQLVKVLLKGQCVQKDGTTKEISLKDMLFVAPYNAQVALLQKKLGADAKVGSVDKFQGQQAPIVFFSMCASDANEISRGMEFLYNMNRINVAISRFPKYAAIVVGNPALFCPTVNSIEQMKLVNLVSRLSSYSDIKQQGTIWLKSQKP